MPVVKNIPPFTKHCLNLVFNRFRAAAGAVTPASCKLSVLAMLGLFQQCWLTALMRMRAMQLKSSNTRHPCGYCSCWK